MKDLHQTGLTPEELQVVSAVLVGYSNKEIAEYFKIVEDTVKHQSEAGA